MEKRMRYLLGGGALISAIAVTLFWVVSGPDQGKTEFAPLSSVTVGSNVVLGQGSSSSFPFVHHGDSPATVASPTLSNEKSSALRSMYLASGDKRQFFAYASQLDESEGRLLALRAADDCSFFLVGGSEKLTAIQQEFERSVHAEEKRSSAKSQDSAARRAAFQALYEPCAGFARSPVDSAVISKLRHQLSQDSTIEGAEARIVDVRLPLEARRRAAIEIAESASRTAFPSLAKYIVQTREIEPLGFLRRDPRSEQVLRTALDLAGCQLDPNACGSNHPLVLAACVDRGHCGLDSFEITIQENALSPYNFRQAKDLSEKVVAAYQARDLKNLQLLK